MARSEKSTRPRAESACAGALRGLVTILLTMALTGCGTSLVTSQTITQLPGPTATSPATATPTPPTPMPSPTPTSTPLPAAFLDTGLLQVPREFHTATLLFDGRVLVTGGSDMTAAGGSLLTSAEIYDPARGTFTATGSMTAPRSYNHAVRLLDGRVMIIGPTFDQRGNTLGNSAEIYDPATAAFARTGPLAKQGGIGTATLLEDGSVLVTGWVAGAACTATKCVSQTELYDPSRGTFRYAGPVGQGFTAATLLSGGRVLLTGSESLQGDYEVAGKGAAIYDPSTGGFTPTGPLNEARLGSQAVRLLDGRVLVVGGRTRTGGNSGPTEIASAEIYNPATGAFSRTGSLPDARGGFTANLLPDGEVLVAGGWTASLSSPTLIPEIYDPATGTFHQGPIEQGSYDNATAVTLADGSVLISGGDIMSMSAGRQVTSPHTEIFRP